LKSNKDKNFCSDATRLVNCALTLTDIEFEDFFKDVFKIFRIKRTYTKKVTFILRSDEVEERKIFYNWYLVKILNYLFYIVKPLMDNDT